MDTPPDSQRKSWARLSTCTSFVCRICFFKALCSDSDRVNGFIVIPPAFDFTRVRLGGVKKILSTYLHCRGRHPSLGYHVSLGSPRAALPRGCGGHGGAVPAPATLVGHRVAPAASPVARPLSLHRQRGDGPWHRFCRRHPGGAIHGGGQGCPHPSHLSLRGADVCPARVRADQTCIGTCHRHADL